MLSGIELLKKMCIDSKEELLKHIYQYFDDISAELVEYFSKCWKGVGECLEAKMYQIN